MTIWFASGNAHKRDELQSIFQGHTIKIPSDEGIPFDPDENGATFAENALIKARALYKLVKKPVLSDDSGLCVDALDGRPGIYSARYGSTDEKKLSDRERNALLLREVGNNPNRKARFVCALVLLFDENRFFLAQETLEGELIREERGTGGFGYDPILYLPDYKRTVAELPRPEKNAVSHRGKAAKTISELLFSMLSGTTDLKSCGA